MWRTDSTSDQTSKSDLLVRSPQTARRTTTFQQGDYNLLPEKKNTERIQTLYGSIAEPVYLESSSSLLFSFPCPTHSHLNTWETPCTPIACMHAPLPLQQLEPVCPFSISCQISSPPLPPTNTPPATTCKQSLLHKEAKHKRSKTEENKGAKERTRTEALSANSKEKLTHLPHPGSFALSLATEITATTEETRSLTNQLTDWLRQTQSRPKLRLQPSKKTKSLPKINLEGKENCNSPRLLATRTT